MKFFHIGDLHFGKMLHQIPLVEADQPFWVDSFLRAVDEHQPDAVVIAGDVYDRKVPSPEAMKLFDHLLTELAKREKQVFVVPGNHDSSVRLSHVGELLAAHGIFIAGELQKQIMHRTIPLKPVPGSGSSAMSAAHPDPAGNVTFWLMPYLYPKAVSDRKVLDREDLSTYDEAARALLSVQEMNEADVNVLVAHQNVLAGGVAPEHSESETIIGGLGEIDASAFDAFDYVALGHIHNAQRIGRETVRYCGCPLYYDFSEVNRDKSLTLVTIHAKDDIQVERVEIPQRHTLLQKSGTLDELLEEGMALEDKDRYYVQCILCDRHVPPHALERLREVYGDCLINVRRGLPEGGGTESGPAGEGASPALSLEEQFALFYQEQQDELLDGDQEGLVHRILEQQSRQGGDYCLDVKTVPENDSQELLDYLLKVTMEEDE